MRRTRRRINQDMTADTARLYEGLPKWLTNFSAAKKT
jgi:hypothetical protein